ncbi:Scr1 family TA system antitoxin-like transcriptional regulator [Amycolatopsis thailandensis]|uniref:Scr1 family TA system antitoxin-like transcriptional regulator n=1 Tax=Amycolatopsis thailandensis TaxID=589330 RepID=UPI00364E2979
MSREAVNARIELGTSLKKAREAIGWSQSRAASALDCTQPKINKIENELVAIRPQDLTRLLRFYEVSDAEADRIRILAAQAKGGPVAGVLASRDYLTLLETEREAAEILGCYSERLPNLFQCEPYIMKQYEVEGALYDITSVLEARREREALFQSDRPPRYRALFSPSSFDRLPGGRKAGLYREQIQHLRRMMDDYAEHLFVHLVPFEANLPYLPHDLTVLKLGGQGKDMVYHEYGGGPARIYRGRQQVEYHIGEWNKVFRQALSVDDSRTALLEMHDSASRW